MDNPYEIYKGKTGMQARFIYQSNSVVTAHEESLNLIGYKGFNDRISKKQIQKLRSQGPGSPMLVCFDSLPESWKKLLVQVFGAPEKAANKSLFEQHYKQDMDALHFYQGYKKDNGIGLDNNLIREYTINASVLNTMGWLKRYMSDQRRSIKMGVGSMVTIDGVLQPSVWQIVVQEANRFRSIEPHTLPEHEDNLRKLLNKYKKLHYPALISGKVGNKNAQVVTPEVEQLLNNLFAGQTHKPSYNDVAIQYDAFINGYLEIINNNTGEVYNPKDFPKISRSSILNYLSKWENRIGNEHVRSNNRQRMIGKYVPYFRYELPKYAGSLISIDDRQPPFYYDNGKRMWWYMGIDMGSSVWTTWVYGESKEGIILEFYRQMVRNYAEWGFNLPAELEGEMSLNSSFLNTFLKEGEMFEYTHIAANNARGKWVERMFEKFRYEYERDEDGWIARPHARLEANQKSDEIKIIPKDRIIQNTLKIIQQWNNRPHPVHPEKTRWQFFCENQNPNLKPTNYRSILLYLGKITKTSCKAGIIQLNNAEFLLGENGTIAYGDQLWQLMCEVNDQKIEIYWLDGNDGKVLKAHIYINNKYICEAIAMPKPQKAQAERTKDDEAKMEIMSKYVATVNRFIKEGKHSIEKITIIDNTPQLKHSKEFKIKGLKQYEVQEEKPTEIMPDIPEDDFVSVEKPIKSSLKDRF